MSRTKNPLKDQPRAHRLQVCGIAMSRDQGYGRGRTGRRLRVRNMPLPRQKMIMGFGLRIDLGFQSRFGVGR